MYSLAVVFLIAPFYLLGLFIFVKVLFLSKKSPMDTSNRIAHMRLVWFAISRPEMFAPYFWWLRLDEYDVVNKES